MRRRVVIAGGGFAGVRAAVDLAADDRFAVTLVSQYSHFRYLPALYKTAKGGRRTGASLRLTDIFAGTGVDLVQATVTGLDRPGRALETTAGPLGYDHLVLALGSVLDYTAAPAMRDRSYPVKTNDEIAAFKHHLHERIVSDRADLRITIVGGGSIGVEMAGALPAYLRRIAANHGLPEPAARLTVVEPGPRLMRSRPPGLSRAVTRRLRDLGVTLRVGEPIERVDGPTVVWAAAVVNPPFFADNGFPLTARGKTAVSPFLEAEPDVYVIGDNADTHLSGLAQTALHHGAYVAADLRRRAAGSPRVPYRPLRPLLPTTLIPIGPGWVAVQWGRLTVSGRPGAALRWLADRLTFRDVESWPKAGERWVEAGEDAPDCAACRSQRCRVTQHSGGGGWRRSGRWPRRRSGSGWPR
ncbi:NAD(P)/FAD-dependent oxidoreductase [Dactylosporangium sp. CS-033363]|uniref:NAD(P)/FAD-dependent oxidoreductase n=1 Tax=Dactylosporangium sp. CS-033363 TaxID=3239935 RepID=UPI003D8E974D